MRTTAPPARIVGKLVSAMVLALGVVTTAQVARATSTGAYLDTIPNGNLISCQGCHDDSVVGTLNPFGNDIYATLDAPVDAGGFPHWEEVRGADSDGDGQTNGQELGDPCSSWQVGQPAPRATGISNPGLAGSLSPTPNEPSCEAADEGGCSMTGRAAPLTAAAAVLALLSLGLPVRRRRSRATRAVPKPSR